MTLVTQLPASSTKAVSSCCTVRTSPLSSAPMFVTSRRWWRDRARDSPFPGTTASPRPLHLSQKLVERVRGRDVDLVPAVTVRPHRRAGGAELVQAGDAVQDEGLRIDARRRVAAQ